MCTKVADTQGFLSTDVPCLLVGNACNNNNNHIYIAHPGVGTGSSAAGAAGLVGASLAAGGPSATAGRGACLGRGESLVTPGLGVAGVVMRMRSRSRLRGVSGSAAASAARRVLTRARAVFGCCRGTLSSAHSWHILRTESRCTAGQNHTPRLNVAPLY